MHYTGMRWGEVTGLEAASIQPGRIRIWWQLAEVNGVFVKIPPKYGSRRAIDIAPFLSQMLAAHLQATEGRRVLLPPAGRHADVRGKQARIPGSAPQELSGRGSQDGGGAHQRRSGYAAWIFKPAATGWYPQRQPQPAHPVPVAAAVAGRPRTGEERPRPSRGLLDADPARFQPHS